MDDVLERYRKKPITWIQKTVQDDESAKWKKILEEKALAYENGQTLGDAIKVEIGIFCGEVWICDSNRDDDALIEKVCTTAEITRADIEDLCEKHNW